LLLEASKLVLAANKLVLVVNKLQQASSVEDTMKKQ
jgi:hypothetical protein